MTEVTPASRAECVEIVRAAHRERIALFVRGSGSELRLSEYASPAALLCTTRLDQVIEHAEGDLTFSAEAGLSLNAAQALLRPHGQRLALAPRAPSATLGGIMARAADGWTRKSCGLVRDQILGCEVVLGDGRVVHSGGRVVKNVSGFDLCRLFTGARGAWGVVLSLTLRLRAVPQQRRVSLHAASDLAAAFATAHALNASLPDAEVVRVRVVNAAHGTTYAVLLSLAGPAARVEEAVASADDLAGSATELALAALHDGGTPQCVVEVLPADTAAATRALLAYGAGGVIDADVATGTVEFMAPRAPEWDPTALSALAHELRGLEPLVSFPAHPESLRWQRAEFGAVDAANAALLRRLAQRFDPRGIFEPGLHSWK